MQLTLTSSIAPSSAPAAGRPQRGLALPWRDSAAMQLDRLAATQRVSVGAGMGGSATVLAMVGGLLVLGLATLWKPPATVRAPAAVVAAPSQPAGLTAPPAGPVVPGVALPVMVDSPTAPTPLPAPAPALSMPEPEGATATAQVGAEEAQRQARARQLAQARRQAAQLAAERAAADEAQRLQRAQQLREQELAAQQRAADETRQRTAAAEQAAQRQPVLALDSRRSVGELCAAAGGFISRQLCQARECRSAEHQADAVCVRLREIETAQANITR
jgi:type IV secretory pathway VirB10-like protein